MSFVRNGYGQVEPNQLSAQKTGQIYASLPLDPAVNVLQNGEFMYYDYVSGKVTADDSTGVAEPMLVFNEIKLYEDFWRRSYKDFAMIRVGDNYVTSTLATAGYGDGATTQGVVPTAKYDGDENPPVEHTLTGHTEYPYRMDGIAPRLFKTNVGDIYTTNMVKTDDPTASPAVTVTYAVGNLLVPVKNTATKTLQLEKFTPAQTGDLPTGMAWAVVKVYTMPDGQQGLKLQRVQ
jgi:hypothetical protein